MQIEACGRFHWISQRFWHTSEMAKYETDDNLTWLSGALWLLISTSVLLCVIGRIQSEVVTPMVSILILPCDRAVDCPLLCLLIGDCCLYVLVLAYLNKNMRRVLRNISCVSVVCHRIAWQKRIHRCAVYSHFKWRKKAQSTSIFLLIFCLWDACEELAATPAFTYTSNFDTHKCEDRCPCARFYASDIATQSRNRKAKCVPRRTFNGHTFVVVVVAFAKARWRENHFNE